MSAIKNLLTTKDVSLMLKVSQGHIRNLVSKDRIPYHKIKGVGVRFIQIEIENWLLEGGHAE